MIFTYILKIPPKILKHNPPNCTFSAKNELRCLVFPDFQKNRIQGPDFFGLKPPHDQDGANKKRLSQIGPAVPALLRHTQTDIHIYRQKSLLLCSI